MPSPSIGLYLGTETVDLVCLGGTFQHPHLLSSGSLPLLSEGTWLRHVQKEETSSVAGTGEITSEINADEGIIRTVQTLLRNTGTPATQIHTAIASEALIIRYFQMPTIPVRERRMAISFEAKKYLPFKLEELITDYRIVIHRSDPTLMRVMFFAIKKSSAAAVLSLLKAVGLKPLSLETTPVSLMRLLRQTGQLSSNQVAAILTVDQNTATIAIAGQDLLYLSRNISLLLPAENTQPPPDLLEALISETRVSIDYYRRRFMGEPSVSKVILFSKKTDPKRVQELTEALNVPVEAGDPFQRIVSNQKEISPGLAVATGLALRGLDSHTAEANLLPQEYKRDLEGLLKPVAIEIVAASLLLALWYGFSQADLHKLEQQNAEIRIGQLHPPGTHEGMGISDLQAFENAQKTEMQLLQGFSKATMNHSDLLTELARLVPQETWIQQAVLEGSQIKTGRDAQPVSRQKTLRLIGASYLNNRDKELEGINRFLAALRSDALFNSQFDEFHLDTVRRATFQKEEVTQFQVTCNSSKDQRSPSGGKP